LIKDLYGLRQAPRAWNVKLDQTLSLDFKKCNLEQAVYTRRSKTSTLIVGVYVDYLIITGTPRKEIDAFKSQMKDRYLLHTRPDLSYSVGLLSIFMQDPKDHHLKAVKQVIRYIKGTKEHDIIYKKEGSCRITGYSDSSYGINTDQGKGTTEERITLKVDNVSAITLVRNPVFYGRSKHIDIRYYFIRECVENRHINVEHVSSELQRADILTMQQMLGVEDLGRSNNLD
nr:ribonuclease H-like domain, reverse transcriptase, RNA-dependent DNA polymerase [Tanacetum cinerariifolium]